MWRIFLWLLVGTFVAVMAMCGVGLWAMFTSSETDVTISAGEVTQIQRDGIESSLDLRLPQASQIKFLRFATHGQDHATYVKLRMTAPELSDFFAQPPLRRALGSSESHGFPLFTDQKDQPEWTPSKVRKGRKARIDLPNEKHLNVLVDDASELEKEVYLQWFETIRWVRQ
jgi:hypothetical protein